MTEPEATPLASALTRRRFFQVGSLVAAGAALAACSSSGNGGGSTSSPSSTPTTSAADTGSTSTAPPTSGASSPMTSAASDTAASSTSSAAPTGPKPTLNAWFHQYGEEGTQQALERYAAAYPNATVKIGWFPGDYDSKVASALLTDTPPDVFEAGNGPTIDAIQGGLVVPMEDMLGDAKSDFPAFLLDRMTWDGHLYAIPQVIDMQLLVYRKSMLNAKGIKPPTTFDELTAAAKALTSGSTKGLFVGNDGGVGILVGPTLWSVGADYLTADNKPGFTDPAVATAFGKLHELFTSGNLLLGAPADWYAADSMVNELCAMQFTGLWTFPDLIKGLGDDFGALPWPAFNSAGKPSVPVGAYGSAVAAKGKNVDASKSFSGWLWVDNTDDQLDFAQSYGFHVPSRASVAAKADKLKSGAALDAVTIMQQNGHAQTPLLWTSKAGTAMTDAVTNIIKSGANPASELAKVVTVTQAELDRVLKK